MANGNTSDAQSNGNGVAFAAAGLTAVGSYLALDHWAHNARSWKGAMVIGGASALVLLVAKHLTNLAKDAPQTTPRPSSNALDQAYFGDDSDPRTYVQSLDAEHAPMQDEQQITR